MLVALLAVTLGLLAPQPAGAVVAAPTLGVGGARLIDTATATPVRLAGVNRSGSEYACIQGWGFFDGPVDDTAIAAIAAWGTNVVRVPLNEDCWLGINGAPAGYSGTNYRNAITALVTRLHAHGLAAVLDLHWAAPGTAKSTGQLLAPDASHASAFWTSVATTFKADRSVAFELFNEPHDISWSCWRYGCTTSAGWAATGMQQLVTAVRNTGATQPLILDGLAWGGDLSGWVANAPNDPAHALVAGWHIYNFSGCNTSSCWDKTAAPVTTSYPVVLTEVGENDCASGFLDQILPWADAHNVGYLGWAWNAASCGGGPSLISDYSGTPTAFGAGFKKHLAGLATATPVTSDPAAVFDFEDGSTQSWTPQWGAVTVANETAVAASGTHGLAINVPGAGYPAVGASAGLAGVTPGATVTYRVYAPGGVNAGVSPVVYDPSWNVTVLAGPTLVAGWNTVKFTVPSTLAGVRILGLQINDGSGWTGTIDLDDVRVTTVRQDFEDGTADGWSNRWGSIATANETGTAFTGVHGLAITVGSSGYPAAGTDQMSGLQPGMPVTMHVWAPSGIAAGVSPIVYDANWNVTVLSGHSLSAGWNTITFTVPASLAGVRIVGLQVNDGAGWSGTIVVDTVSW